MALSGGRPVGYLLGVYVFSLENRGMTAEIDELFVEEPHRRAGAGGRLLRAAEAAFRRAGCRGASLQLGRGNRAARAFYRRHGYRERTKYELLDRPLPRR